MTESAELSTYAEFIEITLDDMAIVVIGNKTQIEEEKDLFDEIHTLY